MKKDEKKIIACISHNSHTYIPHAMPPPSPYRLDTFDVNANHTHMHMHTKSHVQNVNYKVYLHKNLMIVDPISSIAF